MRILRIVGESEEEVLNRLLSWRSRDGSRTIATVLNQLDRLSLHWINWSSLTNDAKTILRDGFHSITLLALSCISFHSAEEFVGLLRSFPALCSLELVRCEGPSEYQYSLSGSKLNIISISGLREASLIHLLTPCPALRTFRCNLYDAGYLSDHNHEIAEASAITRLLASAGSSLEEFNCSVRPFPEYSRFLLDKYLSSLRLSNNNCLRKIELDSRVHPPFILSFLDHLANMDERPPYLHILELPHLPSLSLDWVKLDEILQKPFFHALYELRTDIQCTFDQYDVVRQRAAAWYPMPDLDSVAESVLRGNVVQFRTRLTQCNERGILVLDVHYEYAPKWVKVDNDVVPQLSRRQRVVKTIRKAFRNVKLPYGATG
ncbi:hypothetical protein Moror_8305 [Moniliophthora roreri MCA 2997]|uniref:F-box domain-containing protein n=1 Tax=Moniliophthora roreri (strain MCA 2997) TaxID=1381753 RepID=V2YRE0_MONRO|nr:hypothetical protein Moror_8305 [Moniliophthora roreri MCA 2997]